MENIKLLCILKCVRLQFKFMQLNFYGEVSLLAELRFEKILAEHVNWSHADMFIARYLINNTV